MTITRENETRLSWEIIEKIRSITEPQSFVSVIRRAPLPSGWLVHAYRDRARRIEAKPGPDSKATLALGVGEGTSMAFIADPTHSWRLSEFRSALNQSFPPNTNAEQEKEEKE